MAKYFIFLFGFLSLYLCGCSSNAFLAVSVDSKTGGIYKISSCRSKLVKKLPSLNYLIYAPLNDLYYGTLNRHPDKKGKMGAVAVLRKEKEEFKLLQIVSAEGRTPCHLTLSPDERFLYTANYSSGDISEFRLKAGRICTPARLIKHSGRSISKRQKAPHPHFAGFSPDGKQLFVSDLGTDEIWIYHFSPEKGIAVPCSQKIKLVQGSGPRHLCFSPSGNVLFAANELNSTVSSFKKQKDTWCHIKTLSTLPSPRPAGRNSPGAIKGTKDGRFFFVTNRGHNSLVFFSAKENGDFSFIDAVPSGGDFPSDLLLYDNEKTIAVIHLKSGSVTFWELEKKSKKLKSAGREPIRIFKGIGLCY